MKYYDYDLRWDQRVALIIIQFLNDPYLVRYFLHILRKVIFQDSQEYHISLRENKVNGKIGVPITFGLPFTGETWRLWRMMIVQVNCTHQGFLQWDIIDPIDNQETYREVHEMKEKKQMVNMIPKSFQYKIVNESYSRFRSIVDRHPLLNDLDDLPREEYLQTPFITMTMDNRLVIVN